MTAEVRRAEVAARLVLELRSTSPMRVSPSLQSLTPTKETSTANADGTADAPSPTRSQTLPRLPGARHVRQLSDSEKPSAHLTSRRASSSAASHAIDSTAMAAVTERPPVYTATPLPLPPLWLQRCMAVLYPASLGLDESLADALIRAWTAMLLRCSTSPECASCDNAVVYVTVIAWVIAAHVSSLWWMPIVFRRFETTVALPIEYGAVNFGSVCAGLLLYQEWRYMTAAQLALQVGGLLLILLGITIGRLQDSALTSAWITPPAPRGNENDDGQRRDVRESAC